MPARYGVLFKTHFWDAFVARRFEAFRQTVCGGELYVFVDESQRPAGPVPWDRVWRCTHQEFLDRGLFYIGGSMFWYNNDYPAFKFLDLPDRYDYYVMTEFDVVATIDLDPLIERIAAARIDLVAGEIEPMSNSWNWFASVCDAYPESVPRYRCFFPFAVFSRRALEAWQEARLAQAVRQRQGGMRDWPFAEAFVATELLHRGQTVARLGEFGPMRHFDWYPPYREADLPQLRDSMLLHPVLDDERFVEKYLRHENDPSVFFDPESAVRHRLAAVPDAQVLPVLAKLLVDRRDDAGLLRLQWFLQRPLTLPNGERNVALFKPATQSSTNEWSVGPSPSVDARGAVNGRVTGRVGFHTAHEDHPWWMVDLEAPFDIAAIRVFNRLDIRDRAAPLQVWLSLNGRDWTLAHETGADERFGGADGNPLDVTFTPARRARMVRLEVPKTTHMHLDEVEVFGKPV